MVGTSGSLGLPPPARRLKQGWFVTPVTGLSTSVDVKPFPNTKKINLLDTRPKIRSQINTYGYGIVTSTVVPPEEEGALRVMWFDTACDKWVDGTTCEIKLSGREVSWVSNRTGVLCIVQPRTLDLPYKSWSLAPALPAVQDGPSEVEEACAVLSLETPRMTVK